MKKLLLLGALAAIGLVQASQPSEAYFRGKWCAKMDQGGGVVGERCDFPNFETCRSYVNTHSPDRSACRTNGTQAIGASATTGRNSNSTGVFAEPQPTHVAKRFAAWRRDGLVTLDT